MDLENLEKPAFGYTRVSTNKQKYEGESLETQEARIRDYAAMQGFHLLGIYQDIASALPGNLASRPDFRGVVAAAKRDGAVVIVTSVDRLSRSRQDMMDCIVKNGVPVHAVAIKRRVGRKQLLLQARVAEFEGLQKGRDTKAALKGRTGTGKLGASQNTLVKATANSVRQRRIAAWKTVTDIGAFISDDLVRLNWSRKEMVAALNNGGILTTRGNKWTISAMTRPLRQAKDHVRLQNAPDDGFFGIDA